MSLFSTFYVGTSGMNAQSKATGVISNNIANMTTTGFKRSDTAFQELVTRQSVSSISHNGGVSAQEIQRIGQQGAIQQTSSKLDASINGNGFFTVSSSLNGGNNNPMLYTRNGQFGEFATGNGNESYLRNSAGFYAFGWAIDDAGNVNTGSLVPIQLSPAVDEFVLPTTTGRFGLNLNASQNEISQHLLPAGSQQLPVDDQDPHFSRSITVYDSSGQGQMLNFEFRRIVGPMAHFVSGNNEQMDSNSVLVDDPDGPTSGISDGDVLEINGGGNTLSITFVNGPADTANNEANTMQDIMQIINSFDGGSGSPLFNAYLSGTGNFVVQARDQATTLDISASSASVLGSGGFAFPGAGGVPGNYSYAPEGGAYAGGDFPPPGTVTNPRGWWEATVTDENGGVLAQDLLNFDGAGRLNIQGDPVLSLGQGALGASFNNDINIDIANMTQFSGGYNVLVAEQNGAPLGQRTGTEIRDDGTIYATYSNGQSAAIYKLPVATFINPDGLIAHSGTVYAISEKSGEATLNEAGMGGAGLINGGTLESSNVDIGDEFSKMIVSQRAFSASSQIVQTVNEMTQYLAQLSR